MSSTELIGDLYANYLKENAKLKNDFVTKEINAETAKHSFSSFQLFYKTNSYTLSTEAPSMDVVSLLANIGGTLGLCLGVSLLHFAELLEIIMEGFVLKR